MRGQKQVKTTIGEVQSIALSRNHELTDYETGRNPNTIGKQSYCSFKCNKCNNVWRTRLQVYLERTGPAGGCRKCFNKLIQDVKVYPNSPCVKKNPSLNQPFRRQGKQVLIKNHLNGPHSFIQNLDDLIQFLESNPNLHNDYVLSLINLGARSFLNGESSKHHIIPIHDRGSPEKWNILEVSKAEHQRIHKLRYEVYQQDEDRRAIYATTNDAKIASSMESDNEEIQVETIPAPKAKYFYRRTPETFKAIEQGMIWKHEQGFQVIIPPNTVQTVEQVKQLLMDSLPTDHESRERI